MFPERIIFTVFMQSDVYFFAAAAFKALAMSVKEVAFSAARLGSTK